MWEKDSELELGVGKGEVFWKQRNNLAEWPQATENNVSTRMFTFEQFIIKIHINHPLFARSIFEQVQFGS